jgi:hypothetical protein
MKSSRTDNNGHCIHTIYGQITRARKGDRKFDIGSTLFYFAHGIKVCCVLMDSY